VQGISYGRVTQVQEHPRDNPHVESNTGDSAKKKPREVDGFNAQNRRCHPRLLHDRLELVQGASEIRRIQHGVVARTGPTVHVGENVVVGIPDQNVVTFAK
jgi:hypothetical protein